MYYVMYMCLQILQLASGCPHANVHTDVPATTSYGMYIYVCMSAVIVLYLNEVVSTFAILEL